MVICLERGADLHMAQLMPLPLTVSCFSKILALEMASPGNQHCANSIGTLLYPIHIHRIYGHDTFTILWV